MDRSAQNIDRSSESEIMNLRRRKYAFDVSPLEIIYNEEDFIHGGGGVLNINQINLVIHAIHHDTINQYWSLKSDQQLHSSSSSSSSCDYQHHRDHHHLRDEDDDEEMIMVVCQPLFPPTTRDQIILLDRGVFASNYEDDDHSRQKVIIKEDVDKDVTATADDYIMSQLNDVDVFYELEWIGTYEQLEEVKRCIIQRISESKLDVQLAKPKTVRICVDLTVIRKVYYANPAAAASALAEDELNYRIADECFRFHYSDPINYDDASLGSSNASLRSSMDALETKIFEEEDLISSSSSSSSCSVCLNEFRVGVDVTKKMPCSHVFHLLCLMNWLYQSNTCPLCRHELPTFQSRFPEYHNELPITYLFESLSLSALHNSLFQ